jgi:predicted Zn-dependent protease
MAQLSAQNSGDATDSPPVVVVATTLKLPNPPIVLPRLVPGLPVSTGGSRKQFEGKYSLQKIGQRGVGNGLNTFTAEEEVQLGTRWVKEVDASVAAHLVTDPMITEYVNRIAQNIARASDLNAPITVKVIDSDQVNAFSLPGGFLYISSGMILLLDEEAELAGVVGHEVAHLAARHSTREISRASLIESAFEVSEPKSWWAKLLTRGVRVVAKDLATLKFSRGFEKEADLLGMQYTYAAGYDLSAYPRTLEKLRQKERGKPTFLDRIFSTHPLTQDRIQRCEGIIKDYFPDREAYQLTSSDFENVKARVAEMHMTHFYRTDEEEEEEDRPVLRRR